MTITEEGGYGRKMKKVPRAGGAPCGEVGGHDNDDDVLWAHVEFGTFRQRLVVLLCMRACV